jgi:hypothetical protein
MLNWLYGLVERMLRGRRERKYAHNVYFRSADEYTEGLMPIEILQGQFKGTVFTITAFNILDDYGRCKFEHRILRLAPGKSELYYQTNQFSQVVGEIILVVLGQVSTQYRTLNQPGFDQDKDEVDNVLEEPTEQRVIDSSKARE